MRVTTILSTDDGELEGIVISNVTMGKEIEEILGKLKEEKPGEWDFEDFRMRLPHDCEFYYSWEAETIFD